MKGWKTVLFGAFMAVAPVLLNYLAGVHWTDYVSPEWAGVIVGIIVIALRAVTNTPIGTDKTIIKILIVALGVSLFFPLDARASDISGPAAINKAMTNGYPTKCGAYYGIGTGGNAGAVTGGVPGEQIVQGDIDALVGYTCPFAGNAFWFVEGQFGFANLNGAQNGLSLSGPLVAVERVGVGSPLQQYFSSILPNMNFPAMPSQPSFNGATPSSPQSYAFAGLVEQDIGAQIGPMSGHQWVVAPLVGVGLLTRYSNNMVVDTWAGWQMNSNSFCPGGGKSCAQLGNMARVGVSLKY